MAYSKQGFKDRVRDADGNLLEPGTLLRAEHLEKMEDELIELSGKTIKTDKTLSFENGVLSVNTASNHICCGSRNCRQYRNFTFYNMKG